MSTNPATKAYRKRITRLARHLRFNAAHRWGKDLSLVIEENDPTMPRTMQIKAVDEAISECEDKLDYLRREIEDTKAGMAKLESFKREVFRGPLRIVKSDCGKVRDGRS